MRVGVAIEKDMLFRGAVQPVSNVYHYEAPLPATDVGTWDDLINQIVVVEKAFHASSVSFRRGRLWKADGTKQENFMIIDKQLTGAGSKSNDPSLDRERAVLIQISAGVDSRGRPVKLRKWFHINATAIGTETVTDVQKANTGTLTTAQQATLAAIGEDIRSFSIGVGGSTIATLVSKTGRETTGAAKSHPYLEHHQLGDAWRG